MTDLANQWLSLDCASDSGTGNGSTSDFVTNSKMKSVATTNVFLDGLCMLLTTHYTIDLPTKTVSFVTAPVAGQKINIKYAIGV